MNTDAFTGKAKAYAEARPGYPDEAMEYVRKLAPTDAVYVDIGAGTGKFTALLAKYRNEIFAVEPNADMREQLIVTLAAFTNIKIVDGAAEATTLPDHSVDVITCAQAIGWFDLEAFRTECCRIGKPGAIVVSLYNDMPGDNYVPSNNRLTNKRATDMFFKNPTVRKFSNPIFYTREKWLRNNASISDNPQPSDTKYKAHIAELNAIFERENMNGILRIDLVTKIYSERIV